MQPPSGDLETGAWHFYSFIKVYHQPPVVTDQAEDVMPLILAEIRKQS